MLVALTLHILLGLVTLAHCVYSLIHPRLSHTYTLNLLALTTTFSGTLISQSFSQFCLKLGIYLFFIIIAELRIYSHHNQDLALLK